MSGLQSASGTLLLRVSSRKTAVLVCVLLGKLLCTSLRQGWRESITQFFGLNLGVKGLKSVWLLQGNFIVTELILKISFNNLFLVFSGLIRMHFLHVSAY